MYNTSLSPENELCNTIKEMMHTATLTVDPWMGRDSADLLITPEMAAVDLRDWKKFDEARQGRYMSRQWLVNLWCSVPLSIWYDWHDDGRDPHEAEHHFGLVSHEYRKGQDPVYAPKDAYEAARTMIATMKGFAFAARLDAAADDNYLMRFEKGGQARFAAWTTADKGREVTLKLPAGRYRLIGHTGKPAGTLTADAGGARLALSDAVVYIVPE